VRSRAKLGAEVEIELAAPTTEWASKRNAPTINVYLYDIREDLSKRENGFVVERDQRGMVVSRKPPPRYFKLSYLVTAWTQRPEDEHRLLDELLRAFLLDDALPKSLMVGDLGSTGLAAAISVGLRPPEDRAFADVWSSLGGELKPSLDVVVTVPIDTGASFEAGPPVLEPLIGDFENLDGGNLDARRQRLDRAAGSSPAGARARTRAGERR
jgi:hypothetical protein